jgi:hypothetical protein
VKLSEAVPRARFVDVAIVEDRFTLVFQSAEGSRFSEHATATPKAR